MPHSAFWTPEGKRDIQIKSVETMAAALGNRPQAVIHPEDDWAFGGARYLSRSAILATPAWAQTSSWSPRGEPPTPIAPMISSPDLITTPPATR